MSNVLFMIGIGLNMLLAEGSLSLISPDLLSQSQPGSSRSGNSRDVTVHSSEVIMVFSPQIGHLQTRLGQGGCRVIISVSPGRDIECLALI